MVWEDGSREAPSYPILPTWRKGFGEDGTPMVFSVPNRRLGHQAQPSTVALDGREQPASTLSFSVFTAPSNLVLSTVEGLTRPLRSDPKRIEAGASRDTVYLTRQVFVFIPRLWPMPQTSVPCGRAELQTPRGRSVASRRA